MTPSVGRQGGERHLIAEVMQTTDQPPFDLLTVKLIEIGGTEVAIGGAVAQEVEGDHEDGVTEGDGGPALARRAAKRRY